MFDFNSCPLLAPPSDEPQDRTCGFWLSPTFGRRTLGWRNRSESSSKDGCASKKQTYKENITSPDKDGTESLAVCFDLRDQSPGFDQQGTEKNEKTFKQKLQLRIYWRLQKKTVRKMTINYDQASGCIQDPCSFAPPYTIHLQSLPPEPVVSLGS